MILKVKVILCEEEKKVTIDGDVFNFFTQKEDSYDATSLAISILNFVKQYEEKELVILPYENKEFLTRLLFSLELYNSVAKSKNIISISSEDNLEVSEKFNLIKNVFADYYHDVRMPATTINPETLALRYREAIAKHGLSDEVKITEMIIDEKSMLQAIYAVGKAGECDPRLFIVEFGTGAGPDKNEFSTCVCGKGVCFDTGGVSLKPSDYMIDMNADMGGSALGFYSSLCYFLLFKKPMLFVTGIVENFIGSKAYRPGDVIGSYSGNKIFIGNTDAEGRVVLADCLSYASKNYKIDHIITLATLTGAAKIVCGRDYCPYVPLKGDHVTTIINDLKIKTGEYLVALPSEKYMVDGYISNSGDYADINNIKATRYEEGSHGPGHFLGFFIDRKGVNKEVNYTHFDIANYFELSFSERRSSSDLLEFMVEFINKINK